MRKINHSRIVAGNCLIVPVNSNNSRCSCYRIRIGQTVISVLCMVLLIYIFHLPGISPLGCHRISWGGQVPRYPAIPGHCDLGTICPAENYIIFSDLERQ
uniref:Uncharacterized protein n=1 Tax=virus sp. ct6Ax4 TaxID=2826791 RepID=A0A8S5R742_9VIRU|nr:MAG TPA: hypothetical protein [virus sp. ct6Ax4]